MCGIAGILSTVPQGAEVRDLERLAEAIAHRGPDGQGLWLSPEGSVGLVHRRLAIIDTSSAGHQPMQSADGRYTMVYNGEVFNFLELRRDLEEKGSRFRSDSDSEVILEAWRHWGADMLRRFNGMWALVIHDRESDDVFLARDRFGIKPLLYAQVGRRLAFASEMRSLAALPWVSHALDSNVVRRLMFDPFGVEGSERTLFAAVHRLPAGHLAYWKHGKLSVQRWWNTSQHLVKVPSGRADREAQFLELFQDAIRLRMRSDVSLGTCLSGGFDSSAIVCGMSEVSRLTTNHTRAAQDWRHAFIASFPGQANDETPLALEAAAYAQVTAHTIDLSSVEDEETIDAVLEDLDDIYISLPAAPWQIYRELRAHGTIVSLDGHGADELMGAYRQYGQTLGFALRTAADGFTQRSMSLARGIEAVKWLMLRQRNQVFLRGGWIDVPSALNIPAEHDSLPDHWGQLNSRLYRMFHATVLPTILRNFDRLSMAHGVEVRMPFMDWRLVCYVMSLPDEAKLDAIGSKAIARHALRGHMPESIRAGQRKVGFNSPMPEWMNGALGHWAQRILDTHHSGFDQLVDSKGLSQRVRLLSATSSWNWEHVGRLWPYIHLRWFMGRYA